VSAFVTALPVIFFSLICVDPFAELTVFALGNLLLPFSSIAHISRTTFLCRTMFFLAEFPVMYTTFVLTRN
jgi:hypothetical protein